MFVPSLATMLLGSLPTKSATVAMTREFMEVPGLSPGLARRQVLQSPDRMAVTFVEFGGLVGFLLMIHTNAEAQVLNTCSASESVNWAGVIAIPAEVDCAHWLLRPYKPSKSRLPLPAMWSFAYRCV